MPFDKATRRQIENLLPIDGGVKTEIEAFQGLPEIHGGAPEAQLQLLLRAPLDFVFDQSLEEIDAREFLGGLLRADVERGQDPRQAEVFE